MATAQSKCKKKRHLKNRFVAESTTRKNKARRKETYERRMKKLLRKQDSRIAKLKDQLKAKGIEWVSKEGRRKYYEIRYMQQALKGATKK